MRTRNIYGQGTQEQVFLILCLLVAITLPFSIRLNSYAIILLTINWLIEGDWRKKTQTIIRNKYALLLLSFYLYHVVGLLYTNNLLEGLKDLEKKVTFLGLPLVFATSRYVSRAVLSKVLSSFVGACLIAALICLSNGLFFALKGDASALYYHELSAPLGLHAVYFSLYIGFSIFILLYSLESHWQVWNARRKATFILILLYLTGFLLLLSSKTIIIIVIILLLFFVSRTIFKAYGSIGAITTTVVLILGFGLALFFVPNIKDRFSEVLTDKYEQINPLLLNDYSQYHFTGGTIRLAIWKTAVEIVVEERAWLFGVGTGDSQDLLTEHYIAKHIYPGDEIHSGFITYNAHNQFFQFFITLGSLGLLFFLVTLGFLSTVSILKKDYLLLVMIVIFSAFCLTESVLCAQKGIVFFTFFSTLFVTSLLRENRQ